MQPIQSTKGAGASSWSSGNLESSKNNFIFRWSVNQQWIFSPRWTLSEMGAYGFGLNFHVCMCVCVSATRSKTCMGLFYLYLAQTQHMMVHICTSYLFLTSDPRWPSGGHFSLKTKTKKNCVKHVLSHFSNMHLPMLFKLGTQVKNNDLRRSHTLTI